MYIESFKSKPSYTENIFERFWFEAFNVCAHIELRTEHKVKEEDEKHAYSHVKTLSTKYSGMIKRKFVYIQIEGFKSEKKLFFNKRHAMWSWIIKSPQISEVHFSGYCTRMQYFYWFLNGLGVIDLNSNKIKLYHTFLLFSSPL